MNKMNMFALSYSDRRTGCDLLQIMKMTKEIGVGQVNFMDMTLSFSLRLPRDARKPVIMPIVAFFGQPGAACEFMNMPLFS